MIKVFEFIAEIIGWLWIALSPLLIGLISGFLIYFSYPTAIGLLLAISLTILGLFIGILWANNAWRGKGTVWLLTRVIASPDLDDPNFETKIGKINNEKHKN